MRILCLIEDLGPGGAQRQLVNLSLSLNDRGYQVTFLTFVERNFYQSILEQSNILVIQKIENNPFKRIMGLRKVIRQGNYNAVISFMSNANIVSTLAGLPQKKWRVIVGERSANPIIYRSVKSRIIRFFHLFADYIVANSFANSQMVKKVNPLLSDKKCKTIYNMIDLDNWKPPSDFQFRSTGKLTIVVAASHRHLKNLRGLIDALLLLSPLERSALVIEWYGDSIIEPFYDSSFTDCQSLIKLNGLKHIFNFYEATPDIKEKMAKADVIALFSFFEGLPNSICEGMALGKPILASNVSDLPVLITDGYNGKLCNANKVETIAEGLKYFIDLSIEDLKQLGDKSRKRAVDLFDKEKIVSMYESLLD